MSGPYLLDTNILVHYVRADPVWQWIRQNYSLLLVDPRPGICVVSVGEIRSLANQWNWQGARRSQMELILSYFQHVTIAHEPAYNAYAKIEAYTRRIGRPMGKNDIWIAAAAYCSGSRILTTDHDFDHLAPLFVSVDWIDPASSLPGGP